MIANGKVTLQGRLVAKGVLAQIRQDADSPGWHGTLFITAGDLVNGESLAMDQSYQLEAEDGSSGDFMVARPESVDAGTFVQIQGSGAFRQVSGRE
jgi:hypothetical protein